MAGPARHLLWDQVRQQVQEHGGRQDAHHDQVTVTGEVHACAFAFWMAARAWLTS